MILTGCTTQNSKDKKTDVALLKPKEVIEGFFKYYNQKNLEGANTFTTEKFQLKWEFDNLEYIKIIKIIKIIEDTNKINKEVYLRQMKKGQIIDMDKEKLGLSWKEIKEKYPTEYEEWYINRRYTKSPKRESYQDMLERVLKAIHKIINENFHDVAIVTHSAVIMCLQCYITNTPFDEMMK